jgi:hypothetical protein
MEYPVVYTQRSAWCVSVRSVTYSSHIIDVSDERGDFDGFQDMPF